MAVAVLSLASLEEHVIGAVVVLALTLTLLDEHLIGAMVTLLLLADADLGPC